MKYFSVIFLFVFLFSFKSGVSQDTNSLSHNALRKAIMPLFSRQAEYSEITIFLKNIH